MWTSETANIITLRNKRIAASKDGLFLTQCQRQDEKRIKEYPFLYKIASKLEWFPAKFQFVRLYSDLILVDFDKMQFPAEDTWSWILLNKFAHILKCKPSFRVRKVLFETRKQPFYSWAYVQSIEKETFMAGTYWTFLKKSSGGQRLLLLPIERVTREQIVPAIRYEEPIFLLTVYLWLRVFPKSILLDINFNECHLNYNVCYMKIVTSESRCIFNVKGSIANYSFGEPMYNYQSFDELVVPVTWLSANRLLSKIPHIDDMVPMPSSSIYQGQQNDFLFRLL